MNKSECHHRRQKIQEVLLDANIGCLLVFILAFGLPLTGIGVFFGAMGFNAMQEQVRLNNGAVSVPATIVSSEVRQTTARSGPEIKGSMTTYFAAIEFTYEHDGESRRSSKVWPVDEGGSEQAMRDVVQRYPQGAVVSAFVDPQDPDLAFLEKRWSQMPYVAICIPCLPAAFIAALGVLLVGWKRPGIALLCALAIACVVIGLSALASVYYRGQMPVEFQMWWMWLVFAAVGATGLAPLLATPKARRLHRLSVEAENLRT